jgi:hypothetical protein
MPIRADLRHFYRGPAWRATRECILARAKNRCEQCRVPNHASIERGSHGVWRLIAAPTGTPWRNTNGNQTTFEPVDRHRTRIVLTIAHLNHIAGEDHDENLKALCQWCHLNYDKLHHKQTRSVRKDAARPLLRERL